MAARDGTQLTGQETAEVAFGNVGLLYLASKHYSRSAVHAQPTAVRLREPSKTRDIFFNSHTGNEAHKTWAQSLKEITFVLSGYYAKDNATDPNSQS